MTACTPSTRTSPPVEIFLCPVCDLVLEKISLPKGHSAFCPRCRRRLYKSRTHTTVSRTLALAITGLLLYVPGNFYPLLTLNILGSQRSGTVFGSVVSMFTEGYYLVGITVGLTGLLFPLVLLSLLVLVSAGLRLGWRFPWMTRCFYWYYHLTEWAMLDIYLIGVFITVIKMSHLADIQFNLGLFCFLAMVMSTIGAEASLDTREYWDLLESRPQAKYPPIALPSQTGKLLGRTARLIQCHTCQKIVDTAIQAEKTACPRCGSRLHTRLPHSLNRSWALVITAALLTLPANLLPIMTVETFGNPEANTIMDGIIYFFQEGSYGIGIIILTASILVPLFKIFGMALILLSINLQWSSWLRHKTLIFRFIQFIGRWSMLDIFVIALLCTLVQFGFLSSINVAPAALYFTGVVLTTMFAAITFDPRLLWDTANTTPCHHATARHP